MATRLADLLSRSGTMHWTGRRQRYQCDLGLKGSLVEVGSASQIWNRQATITIDLLARVRAAAPTHAGPSFSGVARNAPMAPQRAGNPLPSSTQRVGAPPPSKVTQAEVTALQQELRRQFELVDANWQKWTPR